MNCPGPVRTRSNTTRRGVPFCTLILKEAGEKRAQRSRQGSGSCRQINCSEGGANPPQPSGPTSSLGYNPSCNAGRGCPRSLRK